MPSKTVGVKLDDAIRAKVMERCNLKSCNISAYLKNLIDKDLAWPVDGNKARLKLEGDRLFIPCVHCGSPASFNLTDLGLARV